MGFRAIIRTWSSFLIVILLTSSSYTQTIHSGIYYHQQPTSVNDSGNFYGGPKPFEGFCGPSAVGMGLQYFIPNIHAILYNLYGDINYHKDNRGELKSYDPYCYDSASTYAFEDFLGHKYIGRHITQEGCGYYELETLIKRIDADINGYSSQTAWINRSQLSEFLDKGFLIVLNTNQGGGHYILIGGWDGSAVYPDKRFYYIWDSWKIPLGLDSTEIQYTRELAGNKESRGSANDILVYKISAPTLNKIFKDQIGDGTMLAFKFIPDNLPPQALAAQTKGIFAFSDNVIKEGSEIFINDMSKHNITDIFLKTRQADGALNTEALDEIIPLAHKKNIKVHAWIPVLKDESLQSNLKGYAKVNDEWANPEDTVYMKHILDDIITPLCRYDIDGIYLDCLFLPEGANVYTGDQKFIDAYYGAIRKPMDKSGKAFASLGAAMIPDGEAGSLPGGQYVFRASKYLNFIIPLLYTNNYLEGPSWAGDQTKYFAGNVSPTCKVLAGLQTLDNYGNYSSSLELRQCADYAIDGGASGIVCFRYPLANWQWEILDHIEIIEHK